MKKFFKAVHKLSYLPFLKVEMCEDELNFLYISRTNGRKA